MRIRASGCPIYNFLRGWRTKKENTTGTFRDWGRPAHKRIYMHNSLYFHRILGHRLMKYVIRYLPLHRLLNCLSAILAPIESYWPQPQAIWGLLSKMFVFLPGSGPRWYFFLPGSGPKKYVFRVPARNGIFVPSGFWPQIGCLFLPGSGPK